LPQSNPPMYGTIDSIFITTNPNTTMDWTQAPCPPIPPPALGFMMGGCPGTSTTPFPLDGNMTLDGVPLANVPNNGVGTGISLPQFPGVNGVIDSVFMSTNPNTTSNVVSTPCPQTQTMWKCQTQGQPCVQDPTGTYNDEVTCNTNCTLPQFEGPCDEFRRWPKRDQKDFCSNCVGRDMEPMCECCVDMGLI